MDLIQQIILLISTALIGVSGDYDDVEGLQYLDPSLEDQAVRPGFKIRITQLGLDYVRDVANAVFVQEMENLQIPDIRDRVSLLVAKADVTVSNIHIREFPAPDSKIIPISDVGLRWEMHNLNPVIHADYNARVKKWFVNINKSGTVRISWKWLSMILEFRIDKDHEGKPTIHVFDCQALGKLNFHFSGGWSNGLKMGASVLKRKIRDIVHQRICEKAQEEIDEQAAWALSKFSVKQTLFKDYEMDFSLVSSPRFNSSVGIDTSHKGTIYSLRNYRDPPFSAPKIGNYDDLTQHMAYVYVTSFLLNSGLYAAWADDVLKINVTKRQAPEEVHPYFRMYCPEDTCIGTIYPTIAQQHPDAEVSLNIHAPYSPQIHFRNGLILLDVHMEADVFADYDRQQNFLFTSELRVEAELTVRIENRRVMFNVTSIQPTGNVKMTSIQAIGMNMFLQTVLQLGTHRYLVPYINAVGANGIELPDIDDVRLTNPVVYIPYEEEGVMIIGMDLHYEGSL